LPITAQGTVANEGGTFVYGGVEKAAPEWLGEIALGVVYGAKDGAAIAARYHNASADPSDYRPTFSAEINDYLFRCSSLLWPNAVRALGLPAFVYRYTYLYSCSDVFPKFGLPSYCATHVCHASELPLVFGNDVPQVNATLTPAEWDFVGRIQQYWGCFAHTGTPNGCSNSTSSATASGTASASSSASSSAAAGHQKPVDTLPEWPLWDAASMPNMLLTIPLGTESSADTCEFWNQNVGFLH
jgi:carboxylesterase type B